MCRQHGSREGAVQGKKDSEVFRGRTTISSLSFNSSYRSSPDHNTMKPTAKVDGRRVAPDAGPLGLLGCMSVTCRQLRPVDELTASLIHHALGGTGPFANCLRNAAASSG